MSSSSRSLEQFPLPDDRLPVLGKLPDLPRVGVRSPPRTAPSLDAGEGVPERAEAPTVSILIPAYNEERTVPQLLRFLQANPPGSSRLLEVLVDVSGSSDRTRQVVEEIAGEWPSVRILDVARRDGLLRAMDRLTRTAQGDLLIRIDADVRLAPGTLTELVRALSSPGVGIASPRIVPELTRSPLVNLVSPAEWELHHQVSLASPKTTLVQAFRRLPISLPDDAGLEDVGIQEQITAMGYRAAYLPGAEVWTQPPSSLKGLLLQRMRTVLQIRNHRARGYSVPSTASLGTVGRALFSLLRERTTPVWSLFGFLTVEAFARAAALISVEGRRAAAFAWEAAEGTKEIDWSATTP